MVPVTTTLGRRRYLFDSTVRDTFDQLPRKPLLCEQTCPASFEGLVGCIACDSLGRARLRGWAIAGWARALP